MPSIMITGSRDWDDILKVSMELWNAYVELGASNDTVLISGGCPSGADHIAETLWKDYDQNLALDIHLADWNTYGRFAGPKRNQEMVDLKPDIVLAFPRGKSVGTRGTIRMAQQAELDVRVFEG